MINNNVITMNFYLFFFKCEANKREEEKESGQFINKEMKYLKYVFSSFYLDGDILFYLN